MNRFKKIDFQSIIKPEDIKKYAGAFDLIAQTINNEKVVKISNMIEILKNFESFKNFSNEKMERFFNEYDGTNSGNLNLIQFSRLMANNDIYKVVDKDNMISKVFKLFDHQAQGIVRKEDVKKTMEQLKIPITDEELDVMYKQFDVSGDGSIDKIEFKSGLERNNLMESFF